MILIGLWQARPDASCTFMELKPLELADGRPMNGLRVELLNYEPANALLGYEAGWKITENVGGYARSINVAPIRQENMRFVAHRGGSEDLSSPPSIYSCSPTQPFSPTLPATEREVGHSDSAASQKNEARGDSQHLPRKSRRTVETQQSVSPERTPNQRNISDRSH